MNLKNIDKTLSTAFDLNHNKKTVDLAVQTEMQGIVSRNIDLVIIYDRPVNIQNTRATASEQGSQTIVTNNLIDFLANGS